jgi:hypothetical protein
MPEVRAPAIWGDAPDAVNRATLQFDGAPTARTFNQAVMPIGRDPDAWSGVDLVRWDVRRRQDFRGCGARNLFRRPEKVREDPVQIIC